MDRRLIITADDFGMCDSVNRAIEECLAAGAVRATCAMMNMPNCSTMACLRQKFPQASLGIHWTLTEGQPVLPPWKVTSLVDSDGRFYSASQLRRRWLQRRIEVNELKSELRAQYQRFIGWAGEPDFWNTHQNFHVYPGLFETCLALGQELRIPAMRCHRRILVPHKNTLPLYNLRHPLYWLKGVGIAHWAKRSESQGMDMPDGMLHMPGYEAAQGCIEQVVNRLPWSSIRKAVEMVIHPTVSSHELRSRRNAERRVAEYQMFADPGLPKYLCERGVSTVGFEILRNAP